MKDRMFLGKGNAAHHLRLQKTKIANKDKFDPRKRKTSLVVS